jgi:ribosomal protein S18 acetylase RimI-like enzyme
MLHARRLSDKAEIRSFLEQDRPYAAYALGDLDAAFFDDCEWWGAERNGHLRALALLYRGLAPPALFLMGEPEALKPILAFPLRPPQVMLLVQAQHLAALRTYYEVPQPVAMLRMWLRAEDFRPVSHAGLIRLTPNYGRELERLYTLGMQPGERPDAFTPLQLAQGVFYGVEREGRLVATAGTHLVALEERIAAVGNVFTHPAWRGRGYATACTSAVTAALFDSGVRDIVLNVAQDNETAVRIYERLGYRRYCPFVEGIAARKGY